MINQIQKNSNTSKAQWKIYVHTITIINGNTHIHKHTSMYFLPFCISHSVADIWTSKAQPWNSNLFRWAAWSFVKGHCCAHLQETWSLFWATLIIFRIQLPKSSIVRTLFVSNCTNLSSLLWGRLCDSLNQSDHQRHCESPLTPLLFKLIQIYSSRTHFYSIVFARNNFLFMLQTNFVGQDTKVTR
jgi:hypothetical protein